MEKFGRIKDKTRLAEKALVGPASEAIWSLLVAKLPFLGAPIIKNIAKHYLSKALYWLSNEGIILFNHIWIGLEVNSESGKLEAARQKAILGLKEGVSDEELDKLDKEMTDAFDDLHRLGRNPL